MIELFHGSTPKVTWNNFGKLGKLILREGVQIKQVTNEARKRRNNRNAQSIL